VYLFIYLPILERQGSYRCLKSLKVVENESSKIKDLIVLEFQQRCLKTLENYFFIWTVLFPRNKCMLTVIFDLQDIESMSTTSVTRGNINRPSRRPYHYVLFVENHAIFIKQCFQEFYRSNQKSPGFKLVVLIGFRDDSWISWTYFLMGITSNVSTYVLNKKLWK
jgi:hypothetical protein